MKAILSVLLCLMLIGGVAQAAQYNPVLSTTSPYPGLTMLQNANSSFAALLSDNSGASAPSYATADMLWANTTGNLLEFYDGANWLTMGKFSGSQWVPCSNGLCSDAPTSTGSSNAYVVTYSPAVTAYVTGQHYPFFTNFAPTASATENVNGLGAKTLKKLGGTNLASGDLGSGQFVDDVYDGTYLQITSQLANAATGSVTSVSMSGGITGLTFSGGPITGSGTFTAGGNLAQSAGGTGATGLDSTLNVNGSGNLAVTTATTSQLGAVEPDGTSISISGGVISVATGGGGNGLTFVHTFTGGSSSITLGSSYFSAAHSRYLININNLYTSDGGAICMELYNGSSWVGNTTQSTCNYSAIDYGFAIFWSGSFGTGTGGSSANPSIAKIDLYGMDVSTTPLVIWDSAYNGNGLHASGSDQMASGTYTQVKFVDVLGGNITGSISLYYYSN